MKNPEFISPIEVALNPTKRDEYLKQKEGQMLIYTDKDGYVTEKITIDELREKFNGSEDSFLLNAERSNSTSTDHVKGNVSWVSEDFDIDKENKRVARNK